MLVNIRNYWNLLPDFSLSHILLRIPLALIFIQQGLSKMPFDPAGGEAFGLPGLVWWVVVWGSMPMPAQARLSEAQAKELAQWVLKAK